uniref:Uncharacterized protein n=1 Tax=Xiphophorus couchianus TaxID=32473 RepID=A0A3B5KRW8_9TELE
MMKLWLPPRTLSYYPNFNRPHLPRCKLRLTHPKCARQRSLLLFHLHLPPHWTRPILWLLPL